MNKDKIKEDFEKKFKIKVTTWSAEDHVKGLIVDEMWDDILERQFAHLSAQYEKLIEECMLEELKHGVGHHPDSGTDTYVDGWNEALLTIRTSLQERGIMIK